MSVFNLFIIILGAILKDVSCLGINLTLTQILGNATHYRIQLIPYGDNPPFVLQFPRFPAQWNHTDKYMIVPKIKTTTWNQYLVSVVLKDKLKQQYKISLIFLMNYQALAMDTTLYDFYATPDSLGLQNINLSNLKNLINQQIDDFPIRNILDEAKIKKLPNLKLQQVFSNIIDPKIIKTILSQGNLAVLIKSIFNLLKKNLSCLQNLAYLEEISTIAKQVLSEKSRKLSESENSYLQENEWIQKKSEDKSEPLVNPIITVDELNELEEKQKSLKIKYYSVIESYIKKLDQEQKVRQFIKSQEHTQKQLQSQRDKQNQIIQLQKDKKKLLSLQKSTANSSNLRMQINDKLKITEKGIDVLTRSFNDLINNMSQLSKSIEQLYNSTDRIQKQISDIEILIDKVQRDLSEVNLKLFTIKTNVTQKSSPQLSLSPYLQTYFKTMPVALNFVVNPLYFINFRTRGQLTSIADQRAQLFILEQIKRYLDRMVDKIYYDCYGIKNVQEADQIGLYLYKIPYSQFISYINRFYLGNSSDKYILSQDNMSKQKIQLRRADVLPTVVSKRLSDVFNSSQMEPIDKIEQLRQGISCKAPAILQSFVGIIKYIKDNIYQVKIPRLQNFFVLKGVCTRVEMSGEESAGKIIFWRGVQISDKIYDAYFILIM